MPLRIQRKRSKGSRMPADAIYVGRPSHHGNKYRVGVDGDAAECVRKFRADWVWGLEHPLGRLVLASTLDKLRGKDLACWCRLDQPCHADVLIELANAPHPEAVGQAPSNSVNCPQVQSPKGNRE